MNSRGPWIIGAAIVVAGALIAGGIYLANDDDFEERLEQQELSDYRASLESTLGNAATAQERYLTDASVYTDSVSDLEDEGFSPSVGVTLEIIEATDAGYCMEATRPELDETWHYDSAVGNPEKGQC